MSNGASEAGLGLAPDPLDLEPADHVGERLARRHRIAVDLGA